MKDSNTACAAAGYALALVAELLHANDVPDSIVLEVLDRISRALRLTLDCEPGAYSADDLAAAMQRGRARLRRGIEETEAMQAGVLQ